MLTAGADVLAVEPRMGATALHKAAQSGNAAVVGLLLDHGAFIDQQRAVLGHTPLMDVAAGIVHWAPAFLDFAEHYGVLPVASPSYWPRVKGKVERGAGYVKRSFLEGRAFTDLADLNAQLDHWLATVANQRVHGTTKAIPAIRYAEEQQALRAAAAVPPCDVRSAACPSCGCPAPARLLAPRRARRAAPRAGR